VFGEWIIQIIAQGQIEEATFLVEEYYQTRFEVRNVVNRVEVVPLFSPACTVSPFYEPSGYLFCRIWFNIQEITFHTSSH
jgi:hypothetical protein